MNITRHKWNNENCISFDASVGYPNIVTAVLVGAMPVFFYMLSKNISIIEDVKLVRRKYIFLFLFCFISLLLHCIELFSSYFNKCHFEI